MGYTYGLYGITSVVQFHGEKLIQCVTKPYFPTRSLKKI